MRKGSPDDRLRFLLNAGEMILALEALGIDLVDIFSPGRTSGKPATLCNNLDAANGIAIPWSLGQYGEDLLAGKVRRLDASGVQLLERRLLLNVRGSPGAVVKRIAKLLSKIAVNLARILLCLRGDFASPEARR